MAIGLHLLGKRGHRAADVVEDILQLSGLIQGLEGGAAGCRDVSASGSQPGGAGLLLGGSGATAGGLGLLRLLVRLLVWLLVRAVGAALVLAAAVGAAVGAALGKFGSYRSASSLF